MVGKVLRFISLAIIGVIAGATLFSIRLDVPRATLEAEYSGEAGHFIDLPSGARAHYRDEGNPDGPPLFLLHDASSSLQVWESWVRLLGDRYHLISIDLPGHGLTGRVPGDDYSRVGMERFVLQLSTALGVDQFALAGHGMGGAVAWDLARRRPERVTHLIIIAPEGVGTVPQDQPLLTMLAGNPFTRPLVRWLAPRWIYSDELYTSFVDDNFVTDDRIDRMWRLNRMAENRVANLRRLSLRAAPELKQYDAAIEVPTLILWGEQDQILPFDRERVMWDLRTKFAGGPQDNPLVTFAGTGHMPQIERANETAAVAAHFLENYEPTQVAAARPSPEG